MEQNLNQSREDNKEVRLLLEELRRQAKDRHFTRANLWNAEANKVENSLSNILFAISSALITVTTIFFSNTLNRNCLDTIFLSTFWGFLVLSIVFGVIEQIRSRRYFVDGARRESKAEIIWSKTFPTWEDYESRSTQVQELYKDFQDDNTPIFMYLQFGSVVISLLILIWRSFVI